MNTRAEMNEKSGKNEKSGRNGKSEENEMNRKNGKSEKNGKNKKNKKMTKPPINLTKGRKKSEGENMTNPLARIRNHHGLLVSMMSDTLNMRESTLYRIEGGDSVAAGTKNLDEIASYCGVPVPFLCDPNYDRDQEIDVAYVQKGLEGKLKDLTLSGREVFSEVDELMALDEKRYEIIMRLLKSLWEFRALFFDYTGGARVEALRKEKREKGIKD